MIASAGAGPRPIHHKDLSADRLTLAISFLLTCDAAQAAEGMAKQISAEDGIRTAADSFHRRLPHDLLRCDILPQSPAVWTYKTKKGTLHLSKVAAEILIEHSKIDASKLSLNPTRTYRIENRRWDPITGGASALIGSVVDAGSALSNVVKGKGKDQLQARGEPAFGSTSKHMAQNLGLVGGSLIKGATIDVPFALAEGLRHGPRMYGEKIRDHGPITDWRSGGIVAGRVSPFTSCRY